MLIKDGVDSIIANRKKKLPLIEQKLKEIEEISLIVESVDSARRKMMQENMTGISSEVFESVKKINLSEYRKSLEALMAQYQEVINRFSRDEISISVVGAARQGKSKLLQSISSLDNSVIPAFDNNDCTGATSIIKNVSGASVSATITFRTELEMIEIIQAYLDVIGVSQKISSFAEIATIDLKNISEKMDDGSPNRAKFEHLSKYVEHFREWSPLIKESKKLIMEQKEIQKYVAQNNGESELSDTREDYYYYLAVKDIEIVCEFANADAGKIVLLLRAS